MLIGHLSQMSPPPCLYDTVIQSYVQLKSVFYGVGRPISWAVLHHRKSMGQILGRSCPPGVQLLPHFEVWSYRACQPLQMWQISHFCEIHSLSYEASKFFNHRKSMGQILGRSCPPGVQLLPHFEVWSYRACQPLQVWWFISFYEILGLSYDPPNFAQCIVNGTFWVIICPWGKHRTPDRL